MTRAGAQAGNTASRVPGLEAVRGGVGNATCASDGDTLTTACPAGCHGTPGSARHRPEWRAPHHQGKIPGSRPHPHRIPRTAGVGAGVRRGRPPGHGRRPRAAGARSGQRLGGLRRALEPRLPRLRSAGPGFRRTRTPLGRGGSAMLRWAEWSSGGTAAPRRHATIWPRRWPRIPRTAGCAWRTVARSSSGGTAAGSSGCWRRW